ncbi:MAG: cyclase family protein [Cyanobacteria bacterium]|nr:cyclase family protein [Cyanobacteriota bacterium]
MLPQPRIIDISQPVSSQSACFPGDTPFRREVTLTYKESGVVNLTSLTMSPHVGTHIDAPSHIQGDLDSGEGMVGDLPLERFVGAVEVVDLSPRTEPITVDCVKERWPEDARLPERLLFKTCQHIRYHVWESDYSFFSAEVISYLNDRGVQLVGLDTPSVDHINSKTLDAHHELVKREMVWLENLDLTRAEPGKYFLVALPLKFTELEASPVRAVLFAE